MVLLVIVELQVLTGGGYVMYSYQSFLVIKTLQSMEVVQSYRNFGE